MSTPLTSRTLDTIQCEITKDMIATIASQARQVIPCNPAPALTGSDRASAQHSSGTDHAHSRSGTNERLPSPPSTPGGASLSSVPPLDTFITNLVLRSRVQAGTLICTLVYLHRLRKRLPKEARGMECTCHRIFLATLIVAGKYLNDASPKNKYWARYSTVFTVAEVNLMEKQLLFLLDFDLRIDNEDLNEAASVFASGSAGHETPLTPTTPPPFGSLKSSTSSYTKSGHTQLPVQIQTQQASKIYPSTLGLGGHHTSQQVAPVPSSATATISRDHSNRHSVSYQQRSASEYRESYSRSAAGPLTHISENDKMQLQPSPKKRAVSRGYHENIPQPSPVYYCNTSVSAGSSASLVSASTACFLQPLEQASLNYASSRYQQQRYDPSATRTGHGPVRTLPRTSSSIPSLRAIPSGNTTTASSPQSGNVYATTRAPRGKRVLRHQSTLPDLYSGDSGSMLQSLSSQDSNLPALPPPARLASGSYTSESSPVNTLVYDHSPATAPATVAAATGGYMRRQTLRAPSVQAQPVNVHSDVHSTLPVSALSALSVAPEYADITADDSTLTNNRKVQPQYSELRTDSQESGDQNSSDNSAGGNGGWHLKSKILHPLSTWFRSTRQQQQHASHSNSAADANTDAAAGGGGCRDERDHKYSTYACDAKAHRSKGDHRRDSRLAFANMPPLCLEPPVSSSAFSSKYMSN
ncbi:PHO85 cyclin-1 [Coemansia erecta]|uniref:PHO85 cyclin-1 n=1 Tax=Coemansia erecta TaxID=147472 RepID=A0A9W7XX11_9FUNG|nr:PHO85 cyclin-1 [Coemansia erecta]